MTIVFLVWQGPWGNGGSLADEFNFLWSEIQKYIAKAMQMQFLSQGQLDLDGRCRYGVLLSPWCSLFVADLIVGMEECEFLTDAEADLISEKLE